MMIIHGFLDLLQDLRIIDGGRNGIFLPVGDLAHHMAEDLAGAGLGQALHDCRLAKIGEGADLLAHHLDQFFFQCALIDRYAVFQYHQSHRHLAAQVVVDAKDRTFRHRRMGCDDLFHLPGGKAVPGHIDYVIDAPHDEDVAILIQITAITGEVIAGVLGEVGGTETLVVIPEGREASRGEGQFDHDIAGLVGLGNPFTIMAEQLHVVARHRHGGGTGMHLHRVDTHGIGHHRPAALGLPPVVDHRNIGQPLFQPMIGGRIEPLSGQEEILQRGDIIFTEKFRLGIFFLDRPECGGSGEEGLHLVFGNDPPVSAGVRGAHRFSFEEDGGAAGQQRGVDNVGVSHHPAHVGAGPEYIAGIHVVNGLHAVAQGYGVTAVIAYNPLRFAGGAGGVENVKRIGGIYRHALGRRGVGHQLVPLIIPPGDQRSVLLGAFQDNTIVRLVFGELNGFVEQRLVGDYPAGFNPAGG